MAYAFRLTQKFTLNQEKKIKELSTGYNSIFKFILALSTGALITLYDEPVLGLDANHRELFYKELISNFIEHPKTIVVSTHLIDEISDILEDVIIIKQGEIILTHPVEEVLQLAYSVSGECTNLDIYTKGKNIIREEDIRKIQNSYHFSKS